MNITISEKSPVYGKLVSLGHELALDPALLAAGMCHAALNAPGSTAMPHPAPVAAQITPAAPAPAPAPEPAPIHQPAAAGMCYASLMQSALPEHAASSPSASSAASTPSMGLFADTDDAAIDIPALSRPE